MSFVQNCNCFLKVINMSFVCRERNTLGRRLPKLCAAGYFRILCFSFNLFVLLFQMATKFLRQMVIKLFGPNYLINGEVLGISFGLGGSQKKWRH